MSTRISASDAETRPRSRTSLLPRIAGLAVCAYWLPGAAAVCAPLRSVFGVRDRLDAADRVLLTFDDGPHPQATPAVLELLRAAGVQATFFLVGEQVERWPQGRAPLPSAPLPLALAAPASTRRPPTRPRGNRRDHRTSAKALPAALRHLQR